MSKRGYAPRLSTVHLMAEVLALPHIAKVRTLPPTSTRSTRIRVTLVTGEHADFKIADLRTLLAEEYDWEKRNA
jgi:hypothetical protein